MRFNMDKDKKWQRVLYVVLSVFCVFAVGILFSMKGCSYGNDLPLTSTVEVSDAADESSAAPADDTAEKTLTGKVIDGGMNNITIETDGGKIYTFGIEGSQVTAGETGITTGSTAEVIYKGELDPANASQQVEVVSVKITGNAPSPTPEPTPEPVVDTAETRAAEVLAGMSVEEKVGQMFIARCPDYEAVESVSEYALGGYILFARDFDDKTEDEIVYNIASYQEAAKIPLLIGVDEEGGSVTRVSDNPNLRDAPFWSPQDLYSEGGFELIESDTEEKCRLLSRLGINLNFAPVCDVSLDPEDFIYYRSFGRSAEETAEFVSLVVGKMKELGTGSVLKHFPGYGNNVDTHTGIAYDGRAYESFVESDFLPFEAGIEAGADVVLVSHNIVECMDAEAPASLSPAVHEILRNELGFAGVIVTDDLIMDGIRDFTGDTEAAVMAVKAGNDLLCCSDFQTQVPAVLAAVQSGEIFEDRLDESVMRILKLKISLGLEI